MLGVKLIVTAANSLLELKESALPDFLSEKQKTKHEAPEDGLNQTNHVSLNTASVKCNHGYIQRALTGKIHRMKTEI